MKKAYNGLEVVKINFDDSSNIIANTSVCKKVYVTHFDNDNNNLCDVPEYHDTNPGGTWTESWTDDPV